MSADQPSGTTDPVDPVEETKRRFKEALSAKQGRSGEDHIDNAPQHVHAHGPAETKRAFRRKTG